MATVSRFAALALAALVTSADAAVQMLVRLDRIGGTAHSLPLPDGSALDVLAIRSACSGLPANRTVVYDLQTGRCEPAFINAPLPAGSARLTGSDMTLDAALTDTGIVAFDSGPGTLCLPSDCRVIGELPPPPTVVSGGPQAPPPPAADISAFNGSPLAIVSGEPVDLSWSAQNVASCQLSASVGAAEQTVSANGSLQVTPLETTIYTLFCSAPGGFDSRQLIVDVAPAPAQPQITSFAASPAAVYSGESVTLSWLSENTDRCDIEGEASGLRPDGNFTLKPALTTTYLLTCTGAGGSATARREVTVSPSQAPVAIEALSARPDSLRQGERTSLSWRSSNADACVFTNDKDRSRVTVDPDGTASFSPGETTRYTLSCHNARSSDSTGIVISVTPISGRLTVSSFTSSPARLIAGGQAQLVWTTAQASGCRVVDDNGSSPKFVPLNGDAWVQVNETTTFRAACAASSGQAESFTTVEVVDETVLVGGFEE